jgi:hypothetical protein
LARLRIASLTKPFHFGSAGADETAILNSKWSHYSTLFRRVLAHGRHNAVSSRVPAKRGVCDTTEPNQYCLDRQRDLLVQ